MDGAERENRQEISTNENKEKLIVRLSRRNTLIEQATRRHYENNPNVIFVYEEEEVLDTPEYWATIARRANIPVEEDDVEEVPSLVDEIGRAHV